MMRRIFPLALLLALAAPAQAQNCSGQPPANTVCAGPPSGGNGFPGFRALVGGDYAGLLSTANTWTATQTISTAGTQKALAIQQAGPTTGSQGTTLFYNTINITDNYGITSGQTANGLTLNLTFGGANTQGSRQGLTVNTILNATPSGSSSFYTGAAFSAQATASAGGTNTGAGAKGSIVGAQSVAVLGSSATNFLSVEGHEITVTTPAGSSMQNRIGLAITGQGSDVQAAQRDEMIALYNIASSVGFQRGIAFDADIGLAPISATGTAILTIGTQTMNTFIDASSATLTTFLRSNNFVVSGIGNISTVGNINMGAAALLSWNGQSIIGSPADGIIELTNNAGNGFTRLQLGGTTASFPAIKRNTTALNFRLADDSADAGITASTATFSGDVTHSSARLILSGSVTNAVTQTGLVDISTTVTDNANAISMINVGGTMNGSGTNVSGIRMSLAFAPSASIAAAQTFRIVGQPAPAGGVTITDMAAAYASFVYNNTAGAVTNGYMFLADVPISNGLKPGTQYGMRVNNQGLAGIGTAYGLYVDTQSTATTNVDVFIAGSVITLNGLATDATHTDRTVCQDTTSKNLFFGSGAAGICLGTSSARFKHDIAPLDVGLDEIIRLDAVSYKLNADYGDPDKTLYGFTADQGGLVLPKLAGRDTAGNLQTFDYMGVVPVLVRAVQELKNDNDNLRTEIRRMGARQ